MGLLVDMQSCADGIRSSGKSSPWAFRNLIRKKQVDSVRVRRHGRPQLAQKLSAFDLVAIGNSTK